MNGRESLNDGITLNMLGLRLVIGNVGEQDSSLTRHFTDTVFQDSLPTLLFHDYCVTDKYTCNW